jgi:hypothetical protein
MAATGTGKTPAKAQPATQKDDMQLVVVDDDEPATTVADDAGLDNALRNSQTAPNRQGEDGWGSDYR